MTLYARALIDYVCQHNRMGALEAQIFCDENFRPGWEWATGPLIAGVIMVIDDGSGDDDE